MNELTQSSRGKPGLIRCFPLFALLLIAYNVAAFAFGHDFNDVAHSLFQLKLMSGAVWAAGWNEVLVLIALGLLFVEILKSTRTTAVSTFEHALSMLVFIGFLVEFLVVAQAGTTIFFLLGVMSLIDVMAGYAVSIAVARKDLNITG
jgi:hypothetical protein